MSSSKDDSCKNKDEFEHTWEAARKGDELDRLIFVCSAHLGMRASEIVAMKKSWINFQSRKVNIPKKDGDFKAKSEASARSIPYGKMRGRVRQELENYFDYHDEIQSNRKTIWYRVKRMGEKAGLPRNIYPHSLRATAAFQLAEAGFSAQALLRIPFQMEHSYTQKVLELWIDLQCLFLYSLKSSIRQFMGWEQLDTAQQYIQQAGTAAEREMEEKGANLW